MRKNKIISVITVILLLTVFILGCSSKNNGNASTDNPANTTSTNDSGNAAPAETDSGEKITLRVSWWGSQSRADRTLAAIKIFEEQNPNIKVSPEFLGWDGYWEKISTAAAGKNLPDVIQMDDAYLPDYVQRGLLEDMTPFVDASTIDLSDVDESYYAAGKIDNKLYALSLGANAFSLVYDPAMFKKAGVAELKPGYTYDEFADTARQLKEKLGKGVWGATLADDIDSVKQYLMNRGAYLYNKEGNGLGYDDDSVLAEWFTYWNKLRDEGVVPAPDVTASITALEDQLIVHQKSPFMTMHSNQIVAVTSSAQRPLKMIELPSYPGGQKSQYLKPSQYFSITSNSKQKEAAAKFINFVTNDVKANEQLGAERGIPIATKVREHLKEMMEPAGQVAMAYVDYVSKNYPPLTNKDPAAASEINEVIYPKIAEQVNYGQITPEQAAKQFREQAEKALAKK
jgi:multiple sugar transport system substrate-binding protein